MLQVILLLLYLRFYRFVPCIDSSSCYGLDLRCIKHIDLNCSKTQDYLWADSVEWFLRILRSRITRLANWSSRSWNRSRQTHLHREPWSSVRRSICTNDRDQLHWNKKMATIRWITLRDFLPTRSRNSYAKDRSNFERACWYPNNLCWRRVSDGTIRGLIRGRPSNH